MAVTFTLPITFTDLYNEFGGDPNNITLSDYLRGGGLVPDVPANSGVPTSLPVSLDDFLGAENTIQTVNIISATTHDVNEPDGVQIGIIITSDGYIDFTKTTVSGGGSSSTTTGNLGKWVDSAPIANGDDFEVYMSILGWQGTAPTGARDSWFGLESDRSVVQDDTPNNSFGVTVEVRAKSATGNSDSEIITIANQP